MDNVELVLDLDQIDYIKDALSMYIEYLRDGDDDDRAKATRVERAYDEVCRQAKYN